MSSSDFRARARQMLEGKWGMAILVTLIAGILGGLLTSASFNINLELEDNIMQYLPNGAVQLLELYLTTAVRIGSALGVIQFIIGGAVQLGYCKYLLKLHDGEEAGIKDLFSEFERLADGLILNLLASIYIVLWTLLFIIPGLVAVYKYAMAPFILLENPGMKPNDAITASKKMMDGHKGELFILELSFLGWAILSAFTLGIGNLWLNPYMNASHAAFYREISCSAPLSPAFDPQEPTNPW